MLLDILSYFYFINIKKHNLTQFIKNKQNINKKKRNSIIFDTKLNRIL